MCTSCQCKWDLLTGITYMYNTASAVLAITNMQIRQINYKSIPYWFWKHTSIQFIEWVIKEGSEISWQLLSLLQTNFESLSTLWCVWQEVIIRDLQTSKLGSCTVYKKFCIWKLGLVCIIIKAGFIKCQKKVYNLLHALYIDYRTCSNVLTVRSPWTNKTL